MTAEYIIRKSMCRKPHCGEYSIESRLSELENMQYSNEYAEPGYSNPEKAILFANWNYFAPDVTDLLERKGYSIEWSDEWTTCENCGKAVRTSPDSYCYQPSYVLLNECEIICLNCLNGDAADYLESLENNPRTALNVSQIDPADYGYVRIQDGFESGLHPGQTDNPKKIYAELSEKYEHILFRVDEVSQFYITFSVWNKTEN